MTNSITLVFDDDETTRSALEWIGDSDATVFPIDGSHVRIGVRRFELWEQFGAAMDHLDAEPDEPDALAATVAALRQADQTGKIDLARTLALMLTPAGAVSEWDSETIELVLGPAQDATQAAGLPWIGSADDTGAHRHWAMVARVSGDEDDYEDDDD